LYGRSQVGGFQKQFPVVFWNLTNVADFKLACLKMKRAILFDQALDDVGAYFRRKDLLTLADV
jgi:hypothetical protein